ncbi:MAG: ribosome-associated translation inhibitor RaiA [Candidatus Magasanikbacteria bacterium]|nr:ribosome-associated translation inhibitor RaiA [Candidatus Magasanikbacteria bacterium]
MKIILKATNFSLTSAISDYIEKKIGGLSKYLSNPESTAIEARVEVGRTTQHHQKGDVFRAEVNLKIPCGLLRAERETGDLYASIDSVHDEMKRQIISFKEKKISKKIRAARRAEI